MSFLKGECLSNFKNMMCFFSCVKFVNKSTNLGMGKNQEIFSEISRLVNCFKIYRILKFKIFLCFFICQICQQVNKLEVGKKSRNLFLKCLVLSTISIELLILFSKNFNMCFFCVKFVNKSTNLRLGKKSRHVF